MILGIGLAIIACVAPLWLSVHAFHWIEPRAGPWLATCVVGAILVGTALLLIGLPYQSANEFPATFHLRP